MCQGKSKSNNQNLLALDQAAQIKEKIYLNLICFPTTKRLYIANNYFPLSDQTFQLCGMKMSEI